MPKRTAPPGRAFSDIRCENHGVPLPWFSSQKKEMLKLPSKGGGFTHPHWRQ